MTESTPVNDHDVASIERATLDAVAPAEVMQQGAWLLPFDSSTVGRAKSAVPLRHNAIAAQDNEVVIRSYESKQLPPQFRLAEVPGLMPIQKALQEQGYRATMPTWVQIANTRDLLALTLMAPAAVQTQASDEWARVYTAEGFDAEDGANRVRLMTRSKTMVYAHVCENGVSLAAGTMSISHGWASIHGMRTRASAQGRGLAKRILVGLAQTAIARGCERVFLQVGADNAQAIGLYAQAQFSNAWLYQYWAHRPL